MREERKRYEEYKKLLAGTDAEKAFDDDYAFAYVESETTLPDGGVFVSFRTGYNTDDVVSFVRRGTKVSTRRGRRSNYGGYSCSCDGTTITEIRNYGFGSKTIAKFDLDFNEISKRDEISYGCCCN